MGRYHSAAGAQPGLAERSRALTLPLACAALALLAGAGLWPARAAVPEWPASPYRYLVVDQDLRTVLEEFGRNTGVRTALADGVKGRVRGSLPQVPPGEFLDALTRSYGLDWYYDGAVLHVSAAGEAGTRFIDLRGLPFAQLAAGLDRAGVADPRYALRDGPSPGLATASGPPRYLQLVSEAAAAMAAQKPTAAAAPIATPVRVFRGSAASR